MFKCPPIESAIFLIKQTQHATKTTFFNDCPFGL